jgi:DNA-binding PadR family transcriptional regulator
MFGGKRMVPLYILGLIERYGPQHGYQIRKRIEEELQDFTQIKLPTIYYHLGRMEADGFLIARREKPDARPEKAVYALTARGEEAFSGMLSEALKFEYRPSFPADAAFFFSDAVEPAALSEALRRHIENLRGVIPAIEAHRAESLRCIPPEFQSSAGVVFNHHLKHFKAELEWAGEALQALTDRRDCHDQG